MQKLVWALVVLLVIVHQDFWFWDVGTAEDGWLVFGFMPVGLFFHACISVAASVTWFLATKHCWPAELESAPPQKEAAP
ncbi:MAG: hypothetical protein AAF790_05520 [Planctomycetota bacterium]